MSWCLDEGVMEILVWVFVIFFGAAADKVNARLQGPYESLAACKFDQRRIEEPREAKILHVTPCFSAPRQSEAKR